MCQEGKKDIARPLFSTAALSPAARKNRRPDPAIDVVAAPDFDLARARAGFSRTGV
jgi:hypothetical protein